MRYANVLITHKKTFLKQESKTTSESKRQIQILILIMAILPNFVTGNATPKLASSSVSHREQSKDDDGDNRKKEERVVSVRFAPRVQIRTHISIKEMTLREIDNAWFSASQFEKIDSNNAIVARRRSHVRGLESYDSHAQALLKKRRNRGYRAVTSAQRPSRILGRLSSLNNSETDRDEIVAEKYKLASARCCKEAIERGLQDEKEAMTCYR